MSVKKLTGKQEKFCQEVALGKTQADAYRAAYDAKNMKPETVQKRASELMADGEVAGRVNELKEMALERHQLTVDDIIRELEEARTMAMTGEKPQASAMVAATLGKAKVLGLITDKQEVTGKDGGAINHSLTVNFVKPT